MKGDCMNCRHFDSKHDYCNLMDDIVHPCDNCGLYDGSDKG